MTSGLVHKTSPHGVQSTIDRLEHLVGAAGSKVFARTDHAAGAAAAGLALRRTGLPLLGNANAGTLLTQDV